jgi:hypothetical protein
MESAISQFEQIKLKVSEKIENAINNPIYESRLIELEEKLKNTRDRFIKTGKRNAEDNAQDDEVESELMKSSAVVETLPEFKEMLNQLSVRFGNQYNWINDYLAHENSHANIAESTGHDLVGYATVFIKDDQGNLSNIQPLHFNKPDLNWSPEEMLRKSIEVTNAPEVYGDKLSEGDMESLQNDKKSLAEIREREDKLRISEIRNDLGLE